MVEIDLSKQKALDADPRAIQEINFTENLDRAGSTTLFFIIGEAKKNCVRFFTKNCNSLVNAIPMTAASLNNLIFISIK